MAWSFGDSFDLYAAPADMANGYWDSIPGVGMAVGTAGRFAGSRCLGWSSISTPLVKSSGVNDAVHHFVLSFEQRITAISGSTLGFYIQLLDGTTGQCCIVFRSDGAILLTSGTPAGTVLATYTGAFTAIATWYAFEIEVVIHNTAGAFRVRKNGNSVNDFDSGAVLNTRGGTANNYANKIQLSEQASITHDLDDLFWQSGSSAGTWLGDIRCYTRMPASDVTAVFSRNGGTTNFGRVSEAQQDGSTTYVYDSNPGDADFYGIGSIASTPVSTIAVTTRMYAQKSDAGTRTAAVQLKSSGTTVASPTLVLTTSGWQWAYRMDLTDPNTSAAWTPVAVNNVTIGPSVVS